MPKSDYAENKTVDWCTGKADTPAVSAGRWIALYTAAPSDTGGGTEVTGGGYARKSTAASDWNAASGGSATNAQALTWTAASADWSSGADITHYGIHDHATAGNLLRWKALAVAKKVLNGDTFSFPAGAITVTED